MKKSVKAKMLKSIQDPTTESKNNKNKNSSSKKRRQQLQSGLSSSSFHSCSTMTTVSMSSSFSTLSSTEHCYEDEDECKQTVRFAPHVEIQETIHLSDYTKKERRSCWYNDNDTKRIHKHLKRTIELILDIKSATSSSSEVSRCNNDNGAAAGAAAGAGAGAATPSTPTVLTKKQIKKKYQKLLNDKKYCLRGIESMFYSKETQRTMKENRVPPTEWRYPSMAES